MKKFLSALLLTLMLTLMPLSYAQDVDKAKMSKAHQKAYDAALALYAIEKTDEKIDERFICSSTVIAKRVYAGTNVYLLLTAGHCITGGGLPDNLTFGVRETLAENASKPALQSVTVVRAQNDAQYDFAILELKSSKEYPVIPIDVTVPKIEDAIYDVNFSLGIAKQVSLGRAASEVMDIQGTRGDCDICKGRYMVQFFAAGGASGSAIVSEKTNKIVGVAEFGFPGTTTGLGVETMTAFQAWLNTPVPVPTVSPKA